MALRIANAVYYDGATDFDEIMADESARAMAVFARVPHKDYRPLPPLANDYYEEWWNQYFKKISKGV